MNTGALLPVLTLAATIDPAAVRFGQSPAPGQPFEVASIKRQTDVVPGGGVTFAARPGGRLVVLNNPVTNLIGNAYGVRRHQLVGGPEWIDSDRYDIQAKAAGDAPRADLMVMLQSLLEDRFKLKVHRETREMPIYVMTVAKGGLKMPPSRDGGCGGARRRSGQERRRQNRRDWKVRHPRRMDARPGADRRRRRR